MSEDRSPWQYTVRCEFPARSRSVAEDWIAWLVDEHIDDVLDAGAEQATLVQVTETPLVMEIRYRFRDEAACTAYLAEHAPRLRQEGLTRFPAETGLIYSRSMGPVIAEHFRNR